MKREWLIAFRKSKGLSQIEVAQAIGKKQCIYSGYELGTRNPKPKTAKKIAKIFGFDWTRFYEDSAIKEE